MSEPPKKSILEQGLAHAQEIALLPDDADLAIIGVKDGDLIRGGLVWRVHDRWQLGGEVSLNVKTEDVRGRVVLIGKGRRR